MHGIQLLHEVLRKGCPEMHGRRLQALVAVVTGVLRGERLTLTDAGRELPGRAYEKHKVKRVDRLLRNWRLHGERQSVYRVLAERVVGRVRGWVPLVVDWTPGHAERFLMLEAAVVLWGRAITVYQEVHPVSAYKKPGVQRRFLRRLARIWPQGPQPVVIADAGFQRAFFQDLNRLGWYWLHRLTEPRCVRLLQDEQWQRVNDLHSAARHRPKALGRYVIGRENSYEARLCIVRASRKFRKDRPNDREHGHGTMARRYRKLYRGPWLLASNLPEAEFTAENLVELYAQRMQIEETFRDLKSHRFGYAMDYTRSRDPQRLQILRLIGALAMYIQALVGLAAEGCSWTRHFQANTERQRRVLSWGFLARRVLRNPQWTVSARELRDVLRKLPHWTRYAPAT